MPVETGEALHGGEQRILRGVGGVGIVTEDAATDRVHTVVVAAQELIERTSIATLSGNDEFTVVGGVDAATVAKRVRSRTVTGR